MVNNIAQVARKHGLSEDTIQYWCKKEDDKSEYFFQKKFRVYVYSIFVFDVFCLPFINYFYTGDTVSSLTPPPMKKPRIDAAESKIMKISDLPDLESGVKIWRKALEDVKSNEVGYKSRIEFLEQKIEKLESKVDELRLPEHKILDLYQQKIKELESKVNIILAKIRFSRQGN